MKKTGIILRCVVCVLFVISGLLFAAIGGWQLVSGDWKLFENDILAMLQTAGKILLALYCVGISLKALRQKDRLFLWGGIQLAVIALAAASFAANHLVWPFVLLAVLYVLLCLTEVRDTGGRQEKKRIVKGSTTEN